MDYSNFMYTTNGNSAVTNKMNMINNFKNLVNHISNNDRLDDTNIKSFNDILNTCRTCNDYSSLISLLPTPAECDICKLRNILSILNILTLRMCKNYNKEDKCCYDVLNEKFSEYEQFLNNKNLYDDDRINNHVENIGSAIKTLNRVNDDITTDYIFYLSPKTLHSVTCNESAAFQDDDACQPNIISKVNPHIVDLLKETDPDYFISKIIEIYNYLVACDGVFTDDRCNTFVVALSKALDMVINNITGKEELLDVLSKCDELLVDYSDDPTCEDNVALMIEFINDATEAINNNPTGEVSPFHEMGLGYIYDIIPKDDNELLENANIIASSLNEAADEYDMISTLNESIKDRIIERHQRKKDAKAKLDTELEQTKYDIERRRLTDDYDREESGKRTSKDLRNQNKEDKYSLKNQKRQDKYARSEALKDSDQQRNETRLADEYNDQRQIEQDKYDTKQQRSQDKYDTKQQRKQDKYDTKQQKKQDKYQQKLNKQEDKFNRKVNAKDADFDRSEGIKDDKYQDKRQKVQDIYDRAESERRADTDLKNQKKEDKYQLKFQKRQDKVDFKNQKRLDKWEQKKSDHERNLDLKETKRQERLEDRERKRQERLEARRQRRDETKIGLNRWKTLELTNANVRKATNAIRKSVKCVASAGTGAVAGVSPILAGSTYLIGSYMKDKKRPANEKQKLVDDIKKQQVDIEEKIAQADSNNEYDKKRALMKMQQKLNSTLKRVDPNGMFGSENYNGI